MRAFSQPMSFATLPLISWSDRWEIPFGLGPDWSVALRNGDSSGPERFLVNKQLVLVAHNWGVLYGTCYGTQIDAINRTMHYLSTNNNVGTDYQLTLFSLTNWPTMFDH
jgi:hypothetical protein